MTTLKITLTPIGRFFFGGETKFADPALEQRRSTYVIHSNYFPQQTALLGMLREQLLLQNGLLRHTRDRVASENESAAHLLIGKTGFQVSGIRNDFGVIDQLSPVFIGDASGQLWQPAPADDCLMPHPSNKGQTVKMKFRLDESMEKPTPVLEHYSPKTGLETQLQSSKSGKNVPLNRFFKRETQIGITKSTKPWRRNNEKERDDDEGLFKQTFLRFHPNTPERPVSFVYFITLKSIQTKGSEIKFDMDTALPLSKKYTEAGFYTLHSSLVTLGGEQSAFRMEVVAEDLSHQPLKYMNREDDTGLKRVILTSDTFAPLDKLRAFSHFVIANAVPFRFFSSIIGQTDHFHSLGKQGLISSNLYHLLQRGGVIYCPESNLEGIETILRQPDFQQIGYNHYQIL